MLAPGTVVDRYVVEYALGAGGAASLYAIRHRVLDTTAALKVLQLAREGLQARLLREGRIQAHLDPAHVVPVVDVIDVDGHLALVMPLVAGCSLDRLLLARALEPAEALALFARILPGVRLAHEAGVVHRDLKPGNVLLDVTPGGVRVRVADFGIARALADEGDTAAGRFLGTPAYASPEQIRADDGIDERADLWALGVMLYELLVDALPYPNDRSPRTPPDLELVPERLRPLVRGLLHPDANQRTASVADVEAVLSTALVPEPLGPSGAIAQAIERAWQEDVAKARSRAEAASAPTFASEPGVPVARLPALIGRDDDVSRVRSTLRARPLVQLVGPGGIGKSSVARQLCETERSLWVDLTSARGIDDVLLGLAEVLDSPSAEAHAIGLALRSLGRQLVVVDNAETVLPDLVPALEGWMASAPDVRWVITTRRALQVPGGQAHRLQALDASDALALLEARVKTRGYALTDSDREAFPQLLAAVGGNPLALELAASGLGDLTTVAELTTEVALDTAELTDPGRGARHREMDGVLQASWDRLGQTERDALVVLSDLPGATSAAGAAAAFGTSTGGARRILRWLLDQSVIRTRRHPVEPDRMRFAPFELVRVFARSRGDVALLRDARARHRDWLLSTVEATEVARFDLRSARQRLIAAERVALLSILERGEPEHGARALLALENRYLATQPRVLQRHAARLARAPLSSDTSLPVAALSAYLGVILDLDEEAADELERVAKGLVPTDPPATRWLVLRRASIAAGQMRRTERALMWADAALEDARDLQPSSVAMMHGTRANHLTRLDRIDEARRGYRRALDLLDESDATARAIQISNLALTYDPPERLRLTRQAAELLMDEEDERLVPNVRANLAVFEQALGHAEAARAHAQRAAEILVGVDSISMLDVVSVLVADARVRDPHEAQRVLDAHRSRFLRSAQALGYCDAMQGAICLDTGDLAGAEVALLRAAEALGDLPDRRRVNLEGHLAVLWALRGDGRRSHRHLERLRACDSPSGTVTRIEALVAGQRPGADRPALVAALPPAVPEAYLEEELLDSWVRRYLGR